MSKLMIKKSCGCCNSGCCNTGCCNTCCGSNPCAGPQVQEVGQGSLLFQSQPPQATVEEYPNYVPPTLPEVNPRPTPAPVAPMTDDPDMEDPFVDDPEAPPIPQATRVRLTPLSAKLKVLNSAEASEAAIVTPVSHSSSVTQTIFENEPVEVKAEPAKKTELIFETPTPVTDATEFEAKESNDPAASQPTATLKWRSRNEDSHSLVNFEE